MGALVLAHVDEAVFRPAEMADVVKSQAVEHAAAVPAVVG